MNIKDQIIKKLEEIVKELTNEDIKIELSVPSDESHGDYSSNVALRLAKVLGKSPLEIAEEIADKFTVRGSQYTENRHSGEAQSADSRIEEGTDSGQARMTESVQFLSRVEAVKPGFINFYLSKEALIKNAEDVLENPEKAGYTQKMAGKKVIVEFTDPNPFKEFHIGHVYTNTVGESLSRLFEAIGAEVQRADYYGDVGMHIGKAIYGLRKMFAEEAMDMQKLGEKSLNERINYFGKAYARGSTAYEEDALAQEEIRKINKLAYLAAQSMWQKEKGFAPQVDYTQGAAVDEKELQEVYEIYVTGRKWSLAYFDSIYQRLGMHFTGEYPESLAGEKGYKLVKEHITDGTFVEDNGAVIFPGKDHGLHTRVFINSLGLPTYEAKELGLAIWKFEMFPYDFSLILTGNEINEYFKVLMKALSILRPELAAKSKHMGHGMVKLASGKKMSSRTGQIISGQEVLDEAKNLAKQKIAEAKIGRETVDETESDKVAEQVGIGAIKYSFLKSGIGKDIPFSFEESVSFEGNSGPYVQYTYTRTQSVLEKAGVVNVKFSTINDQNVIPAQAGIQKMDPRSESGMTNEYDPNFDEMRILRFIQKFPEVVEQSAITYSPNVVTEYLFNLSQMFNTFYQKYRILNASTAEEKEFRLALTATVGIVLKQGLNLLGIAAPDKM